MKNKLIKWVLYSPIGKVLVLVILKAFIKHLRNIVENKYGVKLSPQKMPISGGGPRFEYAANFLDGLTDVEIMQFVDNDFKPAE